MKLSSIIKAKHISSHAKFTDSDRPSILEESTPIVRQIATLHTKITTLLSYVLPALQQFTKKNNIDEVFRKPSLSR